MDAVETDEADAIVLEIIEMYGPPKAGQLFEFRIQRQPGGKGGADFQPEPMNLEVGTYVSDDNGDDRIDTVGGDCPVIPCDRGCNVPHGLMPPKKLKVIARERRPGGARGGRTFDIRS